MSTMYALKKHSTVPRKLYKKLVKNPQSIDIKGNKSKF